MVADLIETSAMVTISRNEYNRLLESDRMLQHLEACGVDNWEGYSQPDDTDGDGIEDDYDEDDIPGTED